MWPTRAQPGDLVKMVQHAHTHTHTHTRRHVQGRGTGEAEKAKLPPSSGVLQQCVVSCNGLPHIRLLQCEWVRAHWGAESQPLDEWRLPPTSICYDVIFSNCHCQLLYCESCMGTALSNHIRPDLAM